MVVMIISHGDKIVPHGDKIVPHDHGVETIQSTDAVTNHVLPAVSNNSKPKVPFDEKV